MQAQFVRTTRTSVVIATTYLFDRGIPVAGIRLYHLQDPLYCLHEVGPRPPGPWRFHCFAFQTLITHCQTLQHVQSERTLDVDFPPAGLHSAIFVLRILTLLRLR